MVKTVLLFRPALADDGEMLAAQKYFDVVTSRSLVKDDFVIPRYSMLPYPRELEYDVKENGGSLINSANQHEYIANMLWYNDLEKFTFKTYTDYDFYLAPEGKYVVKGKTNSKKFSWNRSMYAPDKAQAIKIGMSLRDDMMIGTQGTAYREYIPLKTYEIGINEMPITEEWRFFFFRDKLLAKGYYWSIAQYIPEKMPSKMMKFVERIQKKISKIENFPNFYVLDIAQQEDGKFILVEMNDGCMSGLSCCDPDELYSNLKKEVNANFSLLVNGSGQKC